MVYKLWREVKEMGKEVIEVFDKHAEDYDRWYEKHISLFESEVEVARSFRCSTSIEIGAGTGRFAKKLKVNAGIEPSLRMIEEFKDGIDMIGGYGEYLPVRSNSVECAYLIVTLCFVDDPLPVLKEVARVSERVIACIVPRDSRWGSYYIELGQMGHTFYSNAKFYSVGEILNLARKVGLKYCRSIASLSYSPKSREMFELPKEISPEDASSYGFVCLELSHRC